MKNKFLALLTLSACLSFAQTATINGQRANFRVLVGSAAPSSGTCDAASERGSIYLRTGDQASVPSQMYACKQSGASTYGWGPAGWVAQASAPATCAVGEFWVDTDATPSESLYICTSTNTWTLQSGGGGTGDAASPVTVSYSATPTFTADSNTANVFTITLTGNVTSCTLSSFTTGQVVVLKIVQDGTGGRTFACTGFSGLGAISTVANKTSIQTFVATSASAAVAVGNMVSDETSYAVSFVPSGDATLTLPSGTKSLIAAGDLATKIYAHDTGGDDTYAANPVGGATYCPSALADGVTVELVVDTTNTGSATFNLCGLGALEISAALDGTDLTSGDLVVGKPYLLRYYDTGTDLWIVTLPGTSGGGSSTWSSSNNSVWFPLGVPKGSLNSATFISSANHVVCVAPQYFSGTVAAGKVVLLGGTGADNTAHWAAARYNSSGALQQQTDTQTINDGVASTAAFASTANFVEGDSICLTTDTAAKFVVKVIGGFFKGIVNSQATRRYWDCGGTDVSTGTTTLTFPSNCTTRNDPPYDYLPDTLAIFP